MENKMLSLYDYLGRPAGSDLGKEVAKSATIAKIKLDVRYVSNPKYTGDVFLYPKYWLDEYFKVKQIDDLPY